MNTCPRNNSRRTGIRTGWFALAAAILLMWPLAGARSADAADPATVVVAGGLSPQVLKVAVGTTVSWELADGDEHRIRSTTDALKFDSGGLDPGSVFSFTFGSVGTFTYRDEENKDSPAYAGVIEVTASEVPAGGTPGGGTGGGVPAPPATGPVNVGIANRAFSPRSISVATGTTVVWRNSDNDTHTVTQTGGGFDSGSFDNGATYQHTFDAAGTFAYFCDIHPSMTGVVAVTTPVAGGALPPPPAPPAAPVAPAPVAGQPVTAPAASGGNAVAIVDFAFQPATLTVTAGTNVTWTNAGQARHTVAANDGSFTSPDIRAAATFQRQFDVPGTYLYFCDIHPDMTATIAVTGAAGEPAPPTDPAAATTAAPAPASGGIQITDFAFAPRTINLTAGSSLTFVNAGAARHSATANDGSFDTGLLSRGATSTERFPTAGTFPYFCTIHPAMKGTVVVTGANGEAPPPPQERPTVAPRSGDVQMLDFSFNPAQITVTAGGAVSFVNTGVAPHTATATDASFDTGMVQPGGSQLVTFATPGTFPFFCTIHPDMKGTVLVGGADGAIPAADPAAGASIPSLPTAIDVQVLAESFDPVDARIAQGGTVTWTVMSRSPHIVEADDGSFVSEIITSSETYEFTFDTVGTFQYHDGLTGRMGASVTVVADPSSATAGAAADGATASINIIDLDYDPRAITVLQGATVTWTNTGQAPHTVTERDNAWTSEMLQTGDQFVRVFDTLGNFEYFCTLHPGMVATITVSATIAAAGSPEVPVAAPLAPGDEPGRGVAATLTLVGGLMVGLAAFTVGRFTGHGHGRGHGRMPAPS